MMKKTTMIAADLLLCLLGLTAFGQKYSSKSEVAQYTTTGLDNLAWLEAGWDTDTLGAFYLKSRARVSGAVRLFGFWDTGLNFYTPAGATLSYVQSDTGSFIPGFDNSNNTSLGLDIKRFVATYTVKVCYVSNTVCDFAGAGSRESVVTASVGSTYRRTDGGAGTSYYVKESGTGNAG